MLRLAALLLTAFAAFAQTIDGVLVDNVTRAPLRGVIVTLLGPSRYNDTTDEVGAFHIGPVQPGKYVLNIVKAGYLLPPAKRGKMQIDSDLRLTVVVGH
jgi:carboxypeptidase family protein